MRTIKAAYEIQKFHLIFFEKKKKTFRLFQVIITSVKLLLFFNWIERPKPFRVIKIKPFE